MTLPQDVLKAAREAADLEAMVDCLALDAISSAAAEAAVRAYEQRLIARIVESGRQYVEDTPDDDFEDAGKARAAIRWFTDKMAQDLPLTPPGTMYHPRDGDVVEVLIPGEVRVDHDTCDGCSRVSNVSWTVILDNGDEYEFSVEDLGVLQVRVITTNREVGEDSR